MHFLCIRFYSFSTYPNFSSFPFHNVVLFSVLIHSHQFGAAPWNAFIHSFLSHWPKSDSTIRHGCKQVWLIAGRDHSGLTHTNTGSVLWIHREKRECVCVCDIGFCVSLKTIVIPCLCMYVSVCVCVASQTGWQSTEGFFMPVRLHINNRSIQPL